MFGSGDTLVLISLAGFIGVNALYVIAVAALISIGQWARPLLIEAIGDRRKSQDRTIAFLPAIYVGFVFTIIVDPIVRAYQIPTLNSLTQTILYRLSH